MANSKKPKRKRALTRKDLDKSLLPSAAIRKDSIPKDAGKHGKERYEAESKSSMAMTNKAKRMRQIEDYAKANKLTVSQAMIYFMD